MFPIATMGFLASMLLEVVFIVIVVIVVAAATNEDGSAMRVFVVLLPVVRAVDAYTSNPTGFLA